VGSHLDADLGGHYEFSFIIIKLGNLNINLGGYSELCFIMAWWVIYMQD